LSNQLLVASHGCGSLWKSVCDVWLCGWSVDLGRGQRWQLWVWGVSLPESVPLDNPIGGVVSGWCQGESPNLGRF
jgi:hypothetical protein